MKVQLFLVAVPYVNKTKKVILQKFFKNKIYKG